MFLNFDKYIISLHLFLGFLDGKQVWIAFLDWRLVVFIASLQFIEIRLFFRSTIFVIFENGNIFVVFIIDNLFLILFLLDILV